MARSFEGPSVLPSGYGRTSLERPSCRSVGLGADGAAIETAQDKKRQESASFGTAKTNSLVTRRLSLADFPVRARDRRRTAMGGASARAFRPRTSRGGASVRFCGTDPGDRAARRNPRASPGSTAALGSPTLAQGSRGQVPWPAQCPPHLPRGPAWREMGGRSQEVTGRSWSPKQPQGRGRVQGTRL